MTTRTPRAPRRIAPLVALLIAGSLATVAAGSVTARANGADPAPTPLPTLTWAPLVTFPPVADPGVELPPEALWDGYAIGAADAPITIEAWEDFQCPFCQRWTFSVEPQLFATYVADGTVRVVYRPLSFLGDESRWAAVLGDIAAEQDRFWAYHSIAYANQLGENIGSFSLDRLLEMARLAGLDMDVVMQELTLDAARARFAALNERSMADAIALGISATPSLIVNGVKLPTPDWETLSAAIEEALAASGGGADDSPVGPPAPSPSPAG